MNRVAFSGGSYRLAEKVDVPNRHIASAVTQIDREEIGGARHLGAAVMGHGGSSLSVVLAGGSYRWISKALSTLRHLTRPHRRRIDVAGGRVENGGAFSTRRFQAASMSLLFLVNLVSHLSAHMVYHLDVFVLRAE